MYISPKLISGWSNLAFSSINDNTNYCQFTTSKAKAKPLKATKNSTYKILRAEKNWELQKSKNTKKSDKKKLVTTKELGLVKKICNKKNYLVKKHSSSHKNLRAFKNLRAYIYLKQIPSINTF